MNTVTLYLNDGQVLKNKEAGTIPQLQRKFAIGRTLKGTNLNIEALTVES